ncbi:carboxypeptidase-like regulatory domain-containing protein [Lacicoccus alkaliphilus]|uniref:Carboxypeptidase regulatory-like domain-containing protein n=1 Tax=Lacicoccus alkaliphilus DSM 16010 TaxID=1123231 RepID=A0A1M7KI60_9BACL|nr:carboxypeptidase-like regulatory domain-containing protein [Salinicoccus alkaliphilus]SHM64764.1 Carboxypeptidase regulatory-like domain-containing protein [Salinicoccus alkaliphilus DSM 16010]
MEVIKIKLLFIISSLILSLSPVGALANTLQPSLNADETGDDEEGDTGPGTDDREEDIDTGSSGEEESYWTYPDNSNDDGYYDNDFNDNYYEDENSDWSPAEEYVEPEPEPQPEPEPEPVIEQPVMEEPVIEEPVIREPVTEEPAEIDETPVVDVSVLPVEAFSVSGTVMDEAGQGVSGVALKLTGDEIEAQSIESGNDGSFLFEEVPTGQYEIEVGSAEEYEVVEMPENVEVADRSKRGMDIVVTSTEEAAEEAESMETEEVVLSEETGGFTSMDWTLMATGIIFALISIFVFILKKVRNN